MKQVRERIDELFSMKRYPDNIFYEGDLELLKRTKISIVGSRKPSKYSRFEIQKLSAALAKRGACIVSGGAMGIDAAAHNGAGNSNTIAVLPCGIDERYPKVNKSMLDEIGKRGLLLSQFEKGFKAAPWSFVIRNELVVALGEVLIVGEAEIDSGTMRSVEFAAMMKKDIFVLPHRLGESNGTNDLVKKGMAKPIYDIDEFVARFFPLSVGDAKDDEFICFCENNPTYDEVLAKFPNRVFEAELNGDIKVVNGRVIVL